MFYVVLCFLLPNEFSHGDNEVVCCVQLIRDWHKTHELYKLVS